ncbi:MAG: hypothetical protein AAFY57_11150 [Cyanobacteria bacterium J06642_2]
MLTHDELIAIALQNPEVKAAYDDALEPEFHLLGQQLAEGYSLESNSAIRQTAVPETRKCVMMLQVLRCW